MTSAHLEGKVVAGSAEWIGDERISTHGFVRQEAEEFAFSVRNELDWLNEHMAEVFNRGKLLVDGLLLIRTILTGFSDVVEVFKTPGRLRGKTPRTARRANTVDERVPLSEVFTLNIQPISSPTTVNKFSKQYPQFWVAEDENNHIVSQPPIRNSTYLGKENTDSGYHEMTDDHGAYAYEDKDTTQPKQVPITPPLQSMNDRPQVLEPRSAEVSIGLAQRENGAARNGKCDTHDIAEKECLSHLDPVTEDGPIEPIRDPASPKVERIVPNGQTIRSSHQYSISADTVAAFDAALEEAEALSPRRPSLQLQLQHDSSPSDTSSLVRPVVRKKNSLTFASLPAREPLTNKKSIGPQGSRLSQVDQPRLHADYGDGHFGKVSAFQHPVEAQREPLVLDEEDIEEDIPNEKSEANKDTTHRAKSEQDIKAQSKASTQRLQEKLAMLGKSNPPRLSRSIPTTIAASQTDLPRSIATSAPDSPPRRAKADDADDWIGPMTESQDSATAILTPAVFHGAKSQAEIDNDDKMEVVKGHGETTLNWPSHTPKGLTLAKPPTFSQQMPVRQPAALSYPELNMPASTTPSVSPAQRRNIDGPLSASKAKLYSVLKSAKGIFASTGHFNAQVRPDTRTIEPPPVHVAITSAPSKKRVIEGLKSPQAANVSRLQPTAPASLHNEKGHDERANERRSSHRLEMLRLVEAKHAQEQDELHKEGPEMIGEPFYEKSQRRGFDSVESKPRHAHENQRISRNDDQYPTDLPPPPPPKTQLPIVHLQKPSELRRPLRPTKDIPKARPAPVSIKLASQRIGQVAPSNVSLGLALHESLTQPANLRPNLSKKPSTSSLHTTSSSQSFKTSVSSNSTRPKALEAAARKKEQDEKEVQRKLDQKREMERKRAAKAEEDRRVAERLRMVEQQRQVDTKNALHRQAADQRKLDAVRRNEQARKEGTVSRNGAIEDSVENFPTERVQLRSSYIQDDHGSNSSISRNTNVSSFLQGTVPPINHARPAKRQLDLDGEATEYGEQDNMESPDNVKPKRRRTSESFTSEVVARPTMAPPIRPSNIHKKLSNKFTQGFLNNNAFSHAAPSMLKTAVTLQHNLQHPKTPHLNDLAKFSNAKITFAEQSHPGHPGTTHAQTQPQHQQRILPTTRTPGTAHKSSPQYPNGDSIDLPEIATDSEDSGDENDFIPPDWANSPELRELLKRQQLVDPLQVFGPIAPLLMEDVFKGNKERQARFRARTSSANWNGPDRLTEEERNKDREARERLEKEGAWTYGGSI